MYHTTSGGTILHRDRVFTGVLAKLRKATISFMSFRPSVCLHVSVRMEHLNSDWKNFDEI